MSALGDALAPERVRSGSKTEVPGFARHVRFTLRSRHHQPAPACPFGANNGHRVTMKMRPESGLHMIIYGCATKAIESVFS
jgi:hypothetical protein